MYKFQSKKDYPAPCFGVCALNHYDWCYYVLIVWGLYLEDVAKVILKIKTDVSISGNILFSSFSIINDKNTTHLKITNEPFKPFLNSDFKI